MISCIVVDDEPLALQQLENYIKNTPFLELKGCFESSVEALTFLRTTTVDLLFVDINMPELTGFEFIEAIPFKAKVIFTTAYREYALEGFQVDAADYLLKPISYGAFYKSIEKIQHRYFNSETAPQSTSATNTEPNFIFVRSEYKSVRINIDEIQYIESKKEYLNITLNNSEPIVTHGSLNNIMEKLPSKSFMRVHRSYIVNLYAITIVERNNIVFGKVRIPISDSTKDAFQYFLENGHM